MKEHSLTFFQYLKDRGFVVSAATQKSLQENLVYKTYAKGDLLVDIQDPPRHMIMIFSGVTRTYYTDQDGREVIRAFRAKGEFTGPFTEFIMNIPSRITVQALTEVQCCLIPFELFDDDQDKIILKIRLHFTEQFYILKETREYQLLRYGAKERYKHFLQEHGSYINVIPQYMIASYIGVTPVALSRLLRKGDI